MSLEDNMTLTALINLRHIATLPLLKTLYSLQISGVALELVRTDRGSAMSRKAESMSGRRNAVSSKKAKRSQDSEKGIKKLWKHAKTRGALFRRGSRMRGLWLLMCISCWNI